MGGINGFVLYAQAGGSTGFQSSALFSYIASSMSYTFEVSVSIN